MRHKSIISEIDNFLDSYSIFDLLTDCANKNAFSKSECNFAKINIEPTDTPGFVTITFKLYNGSSFEFVKETGIPHYMSKEEIEKLVNNRKEVDF